MPFYACDDFEIMFNRAGGSYAHDVVTAYVFESYDADQTLITPQMWDTMRDLWDYFNLSDESDDNQVKNANHFSQRRGWFYTGCGIPLNDDGTLNTTGKPNFRQIAPATPDIYRTTILERWAGVWDPDIGDDRFRCLFLDNAAIDGFSAKLVEMVHNTDINRGYLLVGEAIPQDDPTAYPNGLAARLGAPWFGMAASSGPWWNKRAGGDHSKGQGYDPNWSADWATIPVYFGIQYSGGDLLDLYVITSAGDPGAANDMKLGYIYKWILRGGVPVSWSTQTHAKVGAAWNYATARVMPSRHVRCPRLLRSARC